uniref:Carboxypeptidase n=1 Tax=Fagus sylvatica TaxID=28930 RepID=A0A2N9HKJ6_FAGSY
MISQQWIVMGIISCASLVHIFLPVEAFPIADKITSLPGQPQVSFQQFAGYITVDQKQHRALFYYFVEAEAQAASKPLVLWLNGGPGCSSVAGAFLEHGPFKVSGDNLVRNEYNWNKEANMLYLESPAGVGFSYSANKSFYTYVNDEITGHYVPQLAQLIIRSKVKINLKGIAVGNGLLDFGTDFNAADEYYWSHGLISDDVYQHLTKVCNGSEIMRSVINGEGSTACGDVYIRLNKELTDSIDIYDVIGDVCRSHVKSQMNMLYEPLRSKFQTLTSLHSKSDAALSQQQFEEKELICGEGITQKYLNRKDVQKALHAKHVAFDQWSLCTGSNNLQYDMKDREIPTIGVVGSLVKSGIRSLVYSGDLDAAIPFTGSRTLVNKLAKKLRLNTTVPYRAWFEGKQVGGWTQVYGKNQLSFASIRGASHTAPSTQPARSFSLFKAFLAGKPLPNA